MPYTKLVECTSFLPVNPLSLVKEMFCVVQQCYTKACMKFYFVNYRHMMESISRLDEDES